MVTIVKIILLNEQSQVLLNLRGKGQEFPGTWGFFGGKVDKEETPEQALVREIKEELNFDLSEYRKIFEANTDNAYHIYYVGKCNVPLSSLTLGEGDDFGFFSLEDTKKLSIRGKNRKVLALAFK